jgi:arginyl-tRNA synthetase
MTSAPVADPRSQLAQLLADALAEALPEQHGAAIVLERPKQAGHGDYASNLALQLAKPLKRNPRDIAQALVRAAKARRSRSSLSRPIRPVRCTWDTVAAQLSVRVSRMF